MAHYVRSLSNDAYVADINNVKRPELQSRVNKYNEEIAKLKRLSKINSQARNQSTRKREN